MAIEPVKRPLAKRIWGLRGRVRRFYLGVVRPGYVLRSRARREGQCNRCGICCQMGFRCASLVTDGPQAGCKKYQGKRPLNCRIFPIDERCLADRDRYAPDHPCGFRFRPKS